MVVQGDYGEYEDPEKAGAGTVMTFQKGAALARAAADGERAMAFTCAQACCTASAVAVSRDAHLRLCLQVSASDSEDAVVTWTDADTDATGNVYRLVQMSVAECHSSKTDESGSMACVSQKKMATCHAASINVGQQATQASVRFQYWFVNVSCSASAVDCWQSCLCLWMYRTSSVPVTTTRTPQAAADLALKAFDKATGVIHSPRGCRVRRVALPVCPVTVPLPAAQ